MTDHNNTVYYTTSKPLNALLAEVSEGYYKDFQLYLRHINKPVLKLSRRLPKNMNLRHLGLALKNTPITSVDLSNNTINGTQAANFIQALNDNPHITSISFNNNNNIGVKNMKAFGQQLKENTSLTEMDLGWNNIGYIGAEILGDALINNHTLSSLNLRANNIGDVGAEKFCKILRHNTTLQSLDLSRNYITDIGATTLCTLLQNNTSLISLDLRFNKIELAGIKAITGIIPETGLVSVKILREGQIEESTRLLNEALRLNQEKASHTTDTMRVLTEQFASLMTSATTEDPNPSCIINHYIIYLPLMKNQQFIHQEEKYRASSEIINTNIKSHLGQV